MEPRPQRPYDLTGYYQGPQLYTPKGYEYNPHEQRSLLRRYLFAIITAIVIFSGVITTLIISPNSLRLHTHTLFTHPKNCPTNVNAKDNTESTPLHTAVIVSKVDVVRLLLDHGADANVKDSLGITLLHRAAFDGKVDEVRLLLDHGADVNVKDNDGRTPLYEAIEEHHPDVAALLRSRGGHE